MRTVRCSGRLSCHACSPAMYPPPPTPPCIHTFPPTMDTPLPCTCPCHAFPHAMHTPPPATHSPCHGHPSAMHMPLPCMPLPLPHMPPFAMHIPPMDRMTDAYENITFPQLLLRTVIKPDIDSSLCVQCRKYLARNRNRFGNKHQTFHKMINLLNGYRQ